MQDTAHTQHRHQTKRLYYLQGYDTEISQFLTTLELIVFIYSTVYI